MVGHKLTSGKKLRSVELAVGACRPAERFKPRDDSAGMSLGSAAASIWND
jgi:hypothetical protein